MATSLTDDVKVEDWSEPRHAGQPWTRAEWQWTLIGLALLVTFLFFVFADYPMRNLIAVN